MSEEQNKPIASAKCELLDREFDKILVFVLVLVFVMALAWLPSQASFLTHMIDTAVGALLGWCAGRYLPKGKAE